MLSANIFFSHTLWTILLSSPWRLLLSLPSGAEMTTNSSRIPPPQQELKKEATANNGTMKLLILAKTLCFSIFLSGCSLCLLLPRAHHAQWLLGPSAAVFKQQQPVKTSTFSYQAALASETGTEEWPRCLRTFWPPTHQERTFGDCDLQATLKTESPRNGPDTRHNTDEPLKHAQGKKASHRKPHSIYNSCSMSRKAKP